jgi:hypothetical protein
MADAAHLLECPYCGNSITIVQAWTPGGMNDYGGYVLKCKKCSKPFHYYLGRDIEMSRVVDGAEVLATYDRDVGNRDNVLDKYGLEPPQSK